MVRTNFQEFTGDVHVLSNLQVGSNLFANDLAANVLTIAGNVAADYFIGDGGFLSNIATTLDDIIDQGNSVSNTVVFVSGQDPTANTAIVTYANVGVSISNTNPTGEYQLSIGSNIFVNTHASNVLTVIGTIGSNLFIGDGGLLSNIATTLDQIVDQGNTVSNTVQLVSGADATSNAGLVTHKDVGISVSNVNPTGEFQFGVGANLFVNTYSSNVLTVEGNVVANTMTLGSLSVTSAYGLNHVTAQGSVTSDTISLTNATTGLSASSNITAGGNVTAQTVITSANVEVGDRLKFASNVFVDDLRVADLAANLVTYDKTTGELMDSGGLFANKLAVVSVQPPSALTANATTVANHGTYTLTTSGLLAESNTWNAFDGDSAVEWTSPETYSAGGGTYAGTSNLFAGSYVQSGVASSGEWLAIEFPYKTTLRHMKLTPPATVISYPASANLYATNDSLTWTELTNWSDVNPVTSSNVQTVIVNASASYKKYALSVTKSNGSTSNVALGEWKLFAESFSIDGGKISMAQQATTGGETVMDQSGPHGRGTVVLKKYPEIVFDASKYDQNHSTNTYVQAGYTVTASSQATDEKNAANLYNDQFPIIIDNDDGWQSANNTYDGSTGDALSIDTLSGITGATSSRDGSYTTLELPHKIKLSYLQIHTRNSVDHGVPLHPKQVYVYGSNDGSSWTQIGSHLFTSVPATAIWQRIDINSTTPYKYFVLQATSILPYLTTNINRVYILDLEYYGYEEDPPAGDTSVDTTFTSIMNTPQTTGANVYVDANLSSDFTNRVVGPTVSNTHTTYVSAGKYWELSGNVESNVTVEANTFLSGDAPHSVSVWFNSSNLEANVSNTCVFSISDQEKLDSLNLDLQSNTWHNLTYAYQGEGGSRVTYLDGRKVAEDQAEDTFGDYPPFAMTGYSQGGYVVSASSEYDPNSSDRRLAWKAFDSNSANEGSPPNVWQTNLNTYNTSGDFGIASGNTTKGTFTADGVTYTGEWIKLEIPHRFILNYLKWESSLDVRRPKKGAILGSNDDVNWYTIRAFNNDLSWTTDSAADYAHITSNSNSAYKYIMAVIEQVQGGDGNLWGNGISLYGHRENDLVRLPDPTNVLKYPHFIFGAEDAKRGYVIKASSVTSTSNTNEYLKWNPFAIDVPGSGLAAGTVVSDRGWVSDGGMNGSGVADGTNNNSLSGIDGSSSTGGVTARNGPWLQLSLPHKIKVTTVDMYARTTTPTDRILEGYFYGSNDETTWYELVQISTGSDNLASYTNTVKNTVTINSSIAYKHLIYQVTQITSPKTYGSVGKMNFYGTEEATPIPIQIGGGNIDKVANFRVYDKFIDENQALEIWDAQKDVFREVKNSMTLHKGRLGIGTTEPEGRLAVVDEPHNLEEFPPRAMTGYKNYFEGHGEFKVSVSSEQNTTTTLVWHIFAKISDNNINKRWRSDNGLYDNTVNPATTTSAAATFDGIGVRGEWILLEMPYNICLKKYEFVGFLSQTPHTGQIWGSDDNGTTWHHIDTFENAVGVTSYPSPTNAFHVLGNTKYYSKYVFIVEKLTSADDAVSMSSLKYFGTREQGQSILHDGQLTLTKNLTVPRIGPALDADDTPRRDRLVVEYNTSTNPTFEGAVRDTSGRGNDGVFYGGASYNATDKALVFDGNGDYIDRELPSEFTGDPTITISMWIKPTSLPTAAGSYDTYIHLGQNSADDQLQITYYGYDQSYLQIGGFGQGVQTQNSSALPVGQWTHVCAVVTPGAWSTTNKKLYINGQYYPTVLSGSGTTSIPPASGTSRLVIGAVRTSAYDHYADAKLSSIKLYDTALTAEEVKTLYDMGRCDEGHHVVNFSKTRVGIGLGDGEAPRGVLDVRGDLYLSGNIIRNTSSAKSGGVWLPTYQFEVGGSTFVEDQRHGQYHIINNQLTAVYRARVVSNSGAGTLRPSLPGGIQPAGHVTANTIIIGWWTRNGDLTTNIGPYLITNIGNGYSQLFHPGQTNNQVRLDGGSLEANQYWTMFLSYPVE